MIDDYVERTYCAHEHRPVNCRNLSSLPMRFSAFLIIAAAASVTPQARPQHPRSGPSAASSRIPQHIGRFRAPTFAWAARVLPTVSGPVTSRMNAVGLCLRALAPEVAFGQ